jgi:hypothetical protein
MIADPLEIEQCLGDDTIWYPSYPQYIYSIRNKIMMDRNVWLNT